MHAAVVSSVSETDSMWPNGFSRWWILLDATCVVDGGLLAWEWHQALLGVQQANDVEL